MSIVTNQHSVTRSVSSAPESVTGTLSRPPSDNLPRWENRSHDGTSVLSHGMASGGRFYFSQLTTNQKARNMTDSNDKRRDAMAAAIAEMCAELITANVIREIESDAAECDNGESDKPIKAKVSVSFNWEAGKQVPEIDAKRSYTVTKADTADRVVDPAQVTIEFEKMEGGVQ